MRARSKGIRHDAAVLAAAVFALPIFAGSAPAPAQSQDALPFPDSPDGMPLALRERIAGDVIAVRRGGPAEGAATDKTPSGLVALSPKRWS